MSSAQIESLRRELEIARMSAAQLQEELRVLHASPAWRLVAAYRRWAGRSGASAPARIIRRLFPPAAAPDTAATATRRTSPRSGVLPFDRELIHCLNPIYEGRIFYCRNGKRHWARSRAHIESYDPAFELRDVILVSDEQIQQYEVAGPIPLSWPAEAWENPARRNPSTLREIATSRLSGTGIEFGAGTSPLAVPLHCDVKFADFCAQEDLLQRAYEAQGSDFVRLSYIMGLEDMAQIADGSLDFVIASHVIEHVRNPLRTFEQVHRKLKPGGSYVLIVPDMRRTFDHDRQMTALDHLVADYEHPSADRDRTHYAEFYKKVRFAPDELLAEQVDEAIAMNDDIHFHTWTYESFQEMVGYVRGSIAPWRSVWSQPYIEEDPGSIEFYFVLEK